jgi:hypothetical protein
MYPNHYINEFQVTLATKAKGAHKQKRRKVIDEDQAGAQPEGSAEYVKPQVGNAQLQPLLGITRIFLGRGRG